MSSELTYDDFLDRLSIQEVLVDAGYHLNKRDGLRYPSYVRTDSEGRRVRGDKFIVTLSFIHSTKRCIYRLHALIWTIAASSLLRHCR